MSKHNALKAYVGEDKDKRPDKNVALGDKEWLLNASCSVLRAKKTPKTIRYDVVRVG